MSPSRTRMTALITALISIAATFTHPSAATQTSAPAMPKIKVAGLITIRNGEVMNVRTSDGKIVAVVLNPDTKLEEPAGVFGFREKRLDVTALSPGLSVEVQGTPYENDQVVAKTVAISPHGQHSAGAMPSTASPAKLADYEIKAAYDAHFDAGSALLSQADKTGLMNLASNTTGSSGYIIQVQGFADVPGSNAYDQQLSRDRAEAVIGYLENAGHVPVTHIVAPGVLAEKAPAATNEPTGGSPQMRRVEVKLLLKNADNH